MVPKRCAFFDMDGHAHPFLPTVELKMSHRSFGVWYRWKTLQPLGTVPELDTCMDPIRRIYSRECVIKTANVMYSQVIGWFPGAIPFKDRVDTG